MPTPSSRSSVVGSTQRTCPPALVLPESVVETYTGHSEEEKHTATSRGSIQQGQGLLAWKGISCLLLMLFLG